MGYLAVRRVRPADCSSANPHPTTVLLAAIGSLDDDDAPEGSDYADNAMAYLIADARANIDRLTREIAETTTSNTNHAILCAKRDTWRLVLCYLTSPA